jgi:hypothetical protein
VSGCGIFPRRLTPAVADVPLASATWATASDPISPHPVNPRNFLVRGRQTVLATSGDHYGAVSNRDFDYARYLDALTSDGLDLTRTFHGPTERLPVRWGSAVTRGNNPGRFLGRWARSDTPGARDGSNRDGRLATRLP